MIDIVIDDTGGCDDTYKPTSPPSAALPLHTVAAAINTPAM